MKTIICSLAFMLAFISVKAEDKTVTLITSGQGKTKDEAKQNALRNAIEQAFGAFISSHTEVVNDAIVKDEIVSVSSGNIQKYEVISEVELPSNDGFNTTLKSIVSINKLTSFCESKGMKIEIKGSLFAFNVIQKELAASNATKILQELELVAKSITPKMFDFEILANDPKMNASKSYSIPVKITIKANRNWDILYNHIYKTIIQLSLNDDEYKDYQKLNMPTYDIKLITTKHNLNGSFKFYTDLARCKSTEISKKDFEEIAWYKIDFEQNQSQNYNARNLHVGGLFAIEKGIKPSNYNSNYLHFRSDPKPYLLSIQQSVEAELSNWIISSSGKTLLNGSKYNPLNYDGSVNRMKSTLDFISNTAVCCNGLDIRNGLDIVNLGKNPYLSSDVIIINNVEMNAVVGYAFAILQFNLDQIKTLSKLEVKHR